MKCTNKIKLCAVSVAVCMLLTGCGNVSYTFKYNPDSSVSSFRIVNTETQATASTFAEDLCVVSENVTPEDVELSASAAALFNIENGEVLYAKNVYTIIKDYHIITPIGYYTSMPQYIKEHNLFIAMKGSSWCVIYPNRKEIQNYQWTDRPFLH